MANRLVQEKSPYLRQHADNPVDWLPWGEEAFARARETDRPIFLSIGYSTCHWCHVMAHESFEDPAIAEVLNSAFVPVKVDREERPDVDRVYMTYVQAMSGHGGWPLSAWLTPDLRPFFGGTYFPPEDRMGRAGFKTVLTAIDRGWKTERSKMTSEADRTIAAIREQLEQGRKPLAGPISLPEAAEEAFERGYRYYQRAFDPSHGGFGGAPKFPRGATLNFLSRVAWMQGPGTDAASMVAVTLEQMARGGIHDHVGGGFHRYSVDAEWFVPHFEKMLYDQAQIALNFLEARRLTGNERHGWLARDIFDYVAGRLTAPGGGFYSAEDADSVPPEGGKPREGAFYLWSFAELHEVLGSDAGWFCEHFGARPAGNVAPERDPHGDFSGLNLLAQQQSLVQTAERAGLDAETASERLRHCLERLREVRERRPHPARDEKIITAWNGLMISALARGATDLGEDRYWKSAVQAAEFIRRELIDPESGALHRSWLDGRGAVPGFAEDYACLIQGLLDLHEATLDASWLEWAERLQEIFDERFRDRETGAYNNASTDDARLILHLQEDYDGAEPAPSSVAALNLLRLGALRHDRRREEQARATIEAFAGRWIPSPQALPQMLEAVAHRLAPPPQLVLAGDPNSSAFQELARVARESPGPRPVLSRADPRIPWTEELPKPPAGAAAYLCRDFTCSPPISKPSALRAELVSGTRA